jgi:hypothetical protein
MTRVDPTALALCIVFPFLSIVAVIARFRARFLQKNKLAADDWVVIPALVGWPFLETSILLNSLASDFLYWKCREHSDW